MSEEQEAFQFSKNSYGQARLLKRMIEESLGQFFKLRVSTLVELNRVAEEGLKTEPGALRQEPIEIEHSKHQPPDWREVPRLLDEMCDYVNDHWSETPVHLASYVMWRLNWIHPFRDGNGRTSRAVSYLVLCRKIGQLLPGSVAIPQRIKTGAMSRYYQALEDADAADERGEIDLSSMEALLEELILAQVRDAATGSGERTSTPPARDSKEKRAEADGRPRQDALAKVAPTELAKAEPKPWKRENIVVAWIGAAATIIGAILTALFASC